MLDERGAGRAAVVELADKMRWSYTRHRACWWAFVWMIRSRLLIDRQCYEHFSRFAVLSNIQVRQLICLIVPV